MVGVLLLALVVLFVSEGDEPEVLDLETNGEVSPSLGLSAGLDLMALKISTGKSAKPIVRLPMVPSNAEAPPEIGSQGPSSESYSMGRYLIID